MKKFRVIVSWFTEIFRNKVNVVFPTLLLQNGICKAFLFEIHIYFQLNLILVVFQDLSAFRLDHLHSADDNILNVAGVLLRPKVQVHQNEGQTHSKFSIILPSLKLTIFFM